MSFELLASLSALSVRRAEITGRAATRSDRLLLSYAARALASGRCVLLRQNQQGELVVEVLRPPVEVGT